MREARRVVLDNEALQALGDVEHGKHRRALAILEAVVGRPRRSGAGAIVAPTAVRVEAGWDRRSTGAALVNRLRILDEPLDRAAADRAAAIRRALSVSVADAHIGSVLATIGPSAVVTSDVDDMHRIVSHLGSDTLVVRL